MSGVDFIKPHRRNLVLSVLIAGAFIAGALFFKFKPFPYPQIVAAAKAGKKAIARRALEPAAIISSQYSAVSGEASSQRTLDTVLMPINITGIRASINGQFAMGAGGIAVVNEWVVVVDRLGSVYVSRGQELEHRAFPPLTNNIEGFVKSLHAPLSVATLRVHDVEYLPFARALAVSYERFNEEEQLPQLAVSLIRIDVDSFTASGQWETVFVSEPMKESRYAGQAGGGRLATLGADKLLVTVGDYNQDGVMLRSALVAQDPASSFGKIMEIDLSTRKHRVFSRGHRNPQGLVVSPQGEIFSTEHGPAGGDELNLITDGGNYGWPVETLGTDYGVYDWPNAKHSGAHSEYRMPVFAWLPSVGASNLIVVRDFNERWNGDLLVASLKGSSLFRLRRDGHRIVYSESIWIGQRVRDITQLQSGAIALWTDDAQLLFITVAEAQLAKNRRGMGYYGQAELAVCTSCHHFDVTGPTHLAPSLSNIIGRKIGSDSFARYSPALRNSDGAWTAVLLKKFISDPQAFAQGSTMPKLDLSEEDVDRVVRVLVNSPGSN